MQVKKQDPIATLSKIIDRSVKANDDGMIRHAIRKIDENKFWRNHWEILEHFLAQCSVQFPHSFDYVARVVSWRVRTEKKIDRELWTDVVRSVANSSSLLGRDSEALWALWLLKEIKAKPTKQIIDRMLLNNGALVLGFIAQMQSNNALAYKDIHAKLASTLNDKSYTTQKWPLSLELKNLGVNQPAPNSRIDAAMLLPYTSQASLIDWNASPRVFLSDENEIDEPDHAIEDLGSDYDTDESGEADGLIDLDDLL